MVKCEALLAAKLLDMAAEQFSNHGCNDVPDDVRRLLTPEEWRSLAVKVRAMGAPGEYPEVEDAEIALGNDWLLMKVMADIIRTEQGVKDQPRPRGGTETRR